MNTIYNKIKGLFEFACWRWNYGKRRKIFQNFHDAARFLKSENNNSNEKWVDYLLMMMPRDFCKLNTYEYEMSFYLAKALNEIGYKKPIILYEYGATGIYIKKLIINNFLDKNKEIQFYLGNLKDVLDVAKSVLMDMSEAYKFNYVTHLIDNIDIFITNQTIQYVENFFEDFKKINIKPKILIFNLTPIHYNISHSFVTCQNIGTNRNRIIVPHYVYPYNEFVNFFKQLGYELVNEWQTDSSSCIICWHPKYSLKKFTGFYFKKIDLA